MKDQKFEDILKHKLESLEPRTTRFAWIKLIWRLHSGKILLAISAVALLGIAAFVIFSQTRDNSQSGNFEYSNKINPLGKKELENVSNTRKTKYPLDVIKTYSSVQDGRQNVIFSEGGQAGDDQIDNNNASFEQGKKIFNEKLSDITYLSTIYQSINFKYDSDVQLRKQERLTEYFVPADKRKNVFSISIGAGPSLSWYQQTENNGPMDLISNKLKNEHSLWSLTSGMRFNFRMNDILFRTGLDYSTFGEQLDYEIKHTYYNAEASHYSYDTTWGYIYNNPDFGEPVVLGLDSTWNEVYSVNVATLDGKNLYRYFEVPVLVGYSFDRNKLSLKPFAGISVGFLHNAKGKLRNAVNDDFYNVQDKNNVNRISLNLLIELEVRYKIFDKHGIFIRPYFKSAINPILRDYPIGLRYNNAGINIGYSISF